MAAGPRYAIESVDNALLILQRVMSEGRVRVGEVATELGVAKSTAHRLLAMLAYRGFVVQAPDRSYVRGPLLSQPVPAAVDAGRLVEAALPHLQHLCTTVGETVHLMVLDGADVRFARTVESTKALRVGSREGVALPARLTSGGLAILARLSAQDVTRLHPSLAAGSAELVRLMSQLATIRKVGYGLNYEATETGLTAIGMALSTDETTPRAAVSITAPTVRFRRSQILGLLPALDACRQAIERELQRGAGARPRPRGRVARRPPESGGRDGAHAAPAPAT